VGASTVQEQQKGAQFKKSTVLQGNGKIEEAQGQQRKRSTSQLIKAWIGSQTDSMQGGKRAKRAKATSNTQKQ